MTHIATTLVWSEYIVIPSCLGFLLFHRSEYGGGLRNIMNLILCVLDSLVLTDVSLLVLRLIARRSHLRGYTPPRLSATVDMLSSPNVDNLAVMWLIVACASPHSLNWSVPSPHLGAQPSIPRLLMRVRVDAPYYT